MNTLEKLHLAESASSVAFAKYEASTNRKERKVLYAEWRATERDLESAQFVHFIT
jgi:hypothetical protein